MDYSIFKTNKFKISIFIVAVLLASVLIFKAGMVVGFRKAYFSGAWGENYKRNFLGPKRGGLFKGMRDKDLINSHGTSGEIMTINGESLTLKGSDGVEKLILVGKDTLIRRFRDEVKITELKVDDNVIVIGNPNDKGQIEAKFIRLAPPDFFTKS